MPSLVDSLVDELIGEIEDGDEFSARFRIRSRLPSTRIFPVSRGGVTVTATTAWAYPSSCGLRTYTMTLWRNVDWWWDDNMGTRTFTVGTDTRSWSGLPSGNYYIEINTNSTNPSCELSGTIDVT